MEEWESLNCSINDTNVTQTYDSKNYKVLAGIRAGVGLTSALCCLAVIIIIILLKKYKRFSQRLILNIAVAAFIHSLAYTTGRVNYHTTRPFKDPYCKFGGLFIDYAGTVEFISIIFAVLNMFSVGFFRRNISKGEGVYYFITYLSPWLWLWIPVWLDLYGTSGGWCSIQVENECGKRSKQGLYVDFGIWYIPLYTLSLVMIVMLIAVPIKIRWSMRQWKITKNPHARAAKKLVLNEVRPLVFYPLVYLFLNTFSILAMIIRAYGPSNHKMYGLEYTHVFTAPLRGAFVALVFACSRDTWRLLGTGAWRQRWRGEEEEESVQPMESTTVYGEGGEDSYIEKSTKSNETDPLIDKQNIQ